MRFLSDDRVIDANKDRKTLAVIAAGLPRCATSSMQAALESDYLGFGPSMHMAHTYPWPERSQMVIDAMRETEREKRHKILYKFFDGYAATCDFPGVAFTEDLMDMYPDAKIILNQRQSAEVWAKSLGNALMFFNSWTYTLVTLLWKTDRLHWRMQMELFRLFSRKIGTDPYPHDAMYVDLYEKYFAHVRAAAAARGRPVLEWQPQDGWKPICDFLGRPCPGGDVPFPRTNETAEVNKIKVILMARGLLSWAALAGSVWAGVRYGPGLLGKVAEAYF